MNEVRNEARHAGTRHAVVATPNRNPRTAANMAGSSGLVAYKLERISCAAATYLGGSIPRVVIRTERPHSTVNRCCRSTTAIFYFVPLGMIERIPFSVSSWDVNW